MQIFATRVGSVGGLRKVIAIGFFAGSISLICNVTAFAHKAPIGGGNGDKHKHHRSDHQDDHHDDHHDDHRDDDRDDHRDDRRDGRDVVHGDHRDWHHNWDGWHRDWDDRWQNNYGSSWSSYDNDTVIDRNVINKRVTNHPANQENWSSMQRPSDEIPNFHEVHPWLFRGGQPNEDGLYELYQNGVRTIVDLRNDPQQIESERQLCKQHELNFVSIPINKNAGISQEALGRFMQVVETARTRPDKGSVFVHCHMGGDRTGAMIALYREIQDKYPFEKAHDEMLNYGFHDDYSKLKRSVQNSTELATALAGKENGGMGNAGGAGSKPGGGAKKSGTARSRNKKS